MDPVIFISVSLALAAATATDLRSQRIPNALTLPMAALALASHGLAGGVGGLWFSFAGLCLGLGLMLAPYLFGVMGAGDVKLMAAVGACIGPELTLAAFLLTCLAGGGYALFVLGRRPELLRAVFLRFHAALFATAATGGFEYAPAAAGARLPRLCYGVAISLGSVAAMAHAALVHGWRSWLGAGL